MKLNKYFNNMELILLTNYPQMTQLDMDLIQNGNRLIQEEMSYDVSSLKKEHEILILSLNNEHKNNLQFYNGSCCYRKNGECIMSIGMMKREKTYLYRTILASIRSNGKIALIVASFGIATYLFPGGRTVYTQFHIPINVNDDSTYDIK